MSLRAKILLSVAALAAMVSQGRTDGIGRQMPRRAYDFVNSIGVNTHFGYYDTQYGLYEEVLRPRLLELGVKHIRDGTFNDDVARKYRDVGESGVRLLLITSAERVAGQAEAIGPMLWGVEAENEPDGRGGEWVERARTEQQRLYETVRGVERLDDVAVVGVSLANIRNSPELLGDVSQWMDFGGMHPYAAGQYPSRARAASQWSPAKILFFQLYTMSTSAVNGDGANPTDILRYRSVETYFSLASAAMSCECHPILNSAKNRLHEPYAKAGRAYSETEDRIIPSSSMLWYLA